MNNELDKCFAQLKELKEIQKAEDEPFCKDDETPARHPEYA